MHRLRARDKRPGERHENSHITMTGISMLSVLSSAAASSSGGEPPMWLQFMPLVAMAGIFWFLIIRPQMRQQKEHREKVGGLKKGDMVVTAGGLVGKVVRVDDNYCDIELAPGMKVKAVRSTIGDIIPPGGTAPAND